MPHDGSTHELLATGALFAIAVFKFKVPLSNLKNTDVGLASGLERSKLRTKIEDAGCVSRSRRATLLCSVETRRRRSLSSFA